MLKCFQINALKVNFILALGNKNIRMNQVLSERIVLNWKNSMNETEISLETKTFNICISAGLLTILK